MPEVCKKKQMPVDSTEPATASPLEKTEVGSYFVSNYPPYSTWSSDHVPAALAALDKPATDSRPLGLYLHIPFCRKRCKFCYFRVYTDKNASDVEVYLESLAREVALYADRAALKGRQFEYVYFGGGTPSFLSAKQLHSLIDRINRHWTWSAAREVTFECEPGTLQKSKLEAIKQIGVTRLSLGVEHFDDEVLQTNGRAHKSPEIFRAWDWIREVGFRQVNIDLIAGMVGDSEQKWRETVARAITLDADSVTIYQMEVPFNSIIAKESLLALAGPPVANWVTKRAWVKWAFEQFEQAGYEVSSAYTLVRRQRHAGFVYRDSLWHGSDLIGAGVASFSHFAGVHYQNYDTWEAYVEHVSEGTLPIHRALPVTRRQLLIRELILQLKTGHIDPAYFEGKFGISVAKEFADALATLRADGFVAANNGDIRLSREGLLRVDSLLPAFYEPQYRGIRYT